jgi:hypothetical protein
LFGPPRVLKGIDNLRSSPKLITPLLDAVYLYNTFHVNSLGPARKRKHVHQEYIARHGKGFPGEAMGVFDDLGNFT